MLSVPEAQKPFLRILATVSPAERDALKSALESAGPHPYIPELARSVAASGPLDLESTLGVLSVAGSLVPMIRRVGADAVPLVGMVVEASVAAGIAVSKVEQKRLKELLLILLRSSAVTMTLKAAEVALEVDRAFDEARVMTDLRPLFSDNDEVSAGVVMHTLRISLIGTEGISVVLDEADLLQLEQQILRARKKASALREKLRVAGIPTLERRRTE